MNPVEVERIWRAGSDAEDQGNTELAIKLYTLSANENHAPSQNNLANILSEENRFLRRDEAIFWYKKAVRNGYSVAAWNLAMNYKKENKNRWYIYWLKIAAKMGDKDAVLELNRGLA